MKILETSNDRSFENFERIMNLRDLTNHFKIQVGIAYFVFKKNLKGKCLKIGIWYFMMKIMTSIAWM